MVGSHWDVHVHCPFYKYDNGKTRIVCEGIVDGSTITNTYQRKDAYLNQITGYCCGTFDKCEIYRMLMQNKYEE